MIGMFLGIIYRVYFKIAKFYLEIMSDNDTPPSNHSRWDPFLREWVIVAPNRGNRPNLGKTFQPEEKNWTCPFRPTPPKVLEIG